MSVTAEIASSQGGSNPYSWDIAYDDVSRRFTAEGTAAPGIASVVVMVQITVAGATRKVQFLQPGGSPDADTDFPVTFGAGPTLIGATVAPAQVARMVGKLTETLGGLPFAETVTRA